MAPVIACSFTKLSLLPPPPLYSPPKKYLNSQRTGANRQKHERSRSELPKAWMFLREPTHSNSVSAVQDSYLMKNAQKCSQMAFSLR